MLVYRASFAFGVALAASIWPAALAAQEASDGELMQLSTGALRDEIGQRYDAALALSQDASVISSDSSRYMWASQAKAQCGIALGFLKSGTKDPVSVGKCADASRRMQVQAASAALPEPPTMAACNTGPYIVFFEWDRSDITADAVSILDSTIAANRSCSNAPIVVAGYTDLSGSDSYNQGLSERRANAARDYLTARGVDASAISTQGFGESNPRVPTADGVRELQNRRAEITFK